MSKTDQNSLDLPPVEKAAQVERNITLRVFFAKMAEYGISPKNEEQAESMVRTAEHAVQLTKHPAVKKASQANDPILLAEQKLVELSEKHGFNTATKNASDEAAINQLATVAARDPDVYRAMLSLQHAESQSA
jgi:hypothetical protein